MTAKELGDLLKISPRRVRQLAEEGIFEKPRRGRYQLGACVVGYIAALQTRPEKGDLRAERIALMRAQRRRLEIMNFRLEASADEIDAADAAVQVFSIWLLLRLRPVATWLHAELLELGVTAEQSDVAAHLLNHWIVGARIEVEEAVRQLLAEARRREIPIRTYEDLESFASFVAPEADAGSRLKGGRSGKAKSKGDEGSGRGGKGKGRSAGRGVRGRRGSRGGDRRPSDDGADGARLP